MIAPNVTYPIVAVFAIMAPANDCYNTDVADYQAEIMAIFNQSIESPGFGWCDDWAFRAPGIGVIMRGDGFQDLNSCTYLL